MRKLPVRARLEVAETGLQESHLGFYVPSGTLVLELVERPQFLERGHVVVEQPPEQCEPVNSSG